MKSACIALLILIACNPTPSLAGAQNDSVTLNSFTIEANDNLNETSPKVIAFKALCQEQIASLQNRFKFAVTSAGLNFDTQFKFSGSITITRGNDGVSFHGMSCDVQLTSLIERAQFIDYIGNKHIGNGYAAICAQEAKGLNSINTLIVNINEKPKTLFRRASCQISATQIEFN